MIYDNWFNHKSQAYFSEHLQEFKNKDNLKFLQVGVFTGDGTIWLVDNLLTGQNCTLTDVDKWVLDQGANQESQNWFVDVEKIYDQKVKNYANIIKHKKDSANFFLENTESFDFIYLDGDKSPEGRYQDAISAWQTLKPAGLLVCDDLNFVNLENNWQPRPGFNKFLNEISGKYTLIHQEENHTLIQKLETE
jgi:predicted O-methyltransferase YrrM